MTINVAFATFCHEFFLSINSIYCQSNWNTIIKMDNSTMFTIYSIILFYFGDYVNIWYENLYIMFVFKLMKKSKSEIDWRIDDNHVIVKNIVCFNISISCERIFTTRWPVIRSYLPAIIQFTYIYICVMCKKEEREKKYSESELNFCIDWNATVFIYYFLNTIKITYIFVFYFLISHINK